MHALRRAALRTAVSTSRAATAAPRIALFAARTPTTANGAKALSLRTVRLFSHTARAATDESRPKDEQESGQQSVDDARPDFEESVARSEANVQEAVQEVSPSTPFFDRPGPEGDYGTFVRNLVFEVTEEHLRLAFEKYGEITRVHLARDSRGLSRGYGFVHFTSAEARQRAVDNVNGSFWHGRRITCSPRLSDRAIERRSLNPPSSSLFIGNIPYETTDGELNRLFRNLPNLKDVRVAVDRTTGWPRGFAHAEFTDVESASAALEKLKGAALGQRELRIDYAESVDKKRVRVRRNTELSDEELLREEEEDDDEEEEEEEEEEEDVDEEEEEERGKSRKNKDTRISW